jgi:hypothetical protein
VRKLLVLSLLALTGCAPKAADQGATATPDAALAATPAAAATSTAVPVQIVFEGLMAFEPVTAGKLSDGLWALMVDARHPDTTNADVSKINPPCSKGQDIGNYPVHEAGIYVEGAKITLTENGKAPQVLTDPLVRTAEEDIRISVSPDDAAMGFLSTAPSLARLVDDTELQLTTGNAANGKIAVDAKYLVADPGTVEAEASLLGRVRIDSGVASARTNVCATVPSKVVMFGFTKVGTACAPQHAVELAEDVLVTHTNVQSVTITLTKGPQASRTVRTLLLEPDGTAGGIKIAFRNTMTELLDDGFDSPTLCGYAHYQAYQWFYDLTAQPTTGCEWVPCQVPGMGTSGGGKCPTPGTSG